MKALLAFLTALMVLLAACFSYAHWRIYRYRFEHDLLAESTPLLRKIPELNQVGIRFEGLDAHLDGWVSHPRFRDLAAATIGSLRGARAPEGLNQIHVPPSLRIVGRPQGGWVASGWLPDTGKGGNPLARLNAVDPMGRIDSKALETHPMVSECFFANSPSFNELITLFSSSVTNGALSIENNRVVLTGSVRTVQEKETLGLAASRVLTAPGGSTIDNQLQTATPTASKLGAAFSWTGFDLRRVLAGFPIYFDSGSTVLKAEESGKIDRLASAIQQLGPRSRYAIAGYADSKGNPAANMKLSLKRAEVVAAQLTARGVPRQQLGVSAVGDKPSTGAPKNVDSQKHNRRVEVSLQP